MANDLYLSLTQNIDSDLIQNDRGSVGDFFSLFYFLKAALLCYTCIWASLARSPQWRQRERGLAEEKTQQKRRTQRGFHTTHATITAGAAGSLGSDAQCTSLSPPLRPSRCPPERTSVWPSKSPGASRRHAPRGYLTCYWLMQLFMPRYTLKTLVFCRVVFSMVG